MAEEKEKREINGQQAILSYSPSSIVNVFNNALNNDTTRRIIRAKGIYVPGKGVSYSGYYYDQLKEESSDACMTLIIPALIRSTMVPQQTIECNGYLTKKVQINGARIELQLNLIELLVQVDSKYTEEQIQAFKILQKKVDTGYRDVDSFVKTKIINSEPVKVIILIGKSGIIDSDIKHQLKEAISFYDFHFVRINLSSEQEIIEALRAHNEQTDLLIISRGGGENISIFNKPVIAETALLLKSHFITAIGHKEDNSLLQKIADKAFITPTALGQYFNDIYNQTIAELQDSKAKLVDDITKQLQVNYEQKIKNLEEKIKASESLATKTTESTEVLYRREITLLKDQITNTTRLHEQQLKELNRINQQKITIAKKEANNSSVFVILIFLAIVIGIFIGRGCR